MKLKTLTTAIIGIGAASALQVFSAEQDNQAYRDGYNLVLEQKWEEAQAWFSRFQTDWPASDWADDAAFWNCYATEQRDAQQETPFNCYQSFINSWPQSTWASDARSKLAVLGTRLASLGNPEYMNQVRDSIDFDRDFDFDFDFDFDGDAIADTVRNAMSAAGLDDIDNLVRNTMAVAEREMERARRIRATMPDLPELPELPEAPSAPEASAADWSAYRDRVQRYRDEIQRAVQERNARGRNSGDDELLAIISSLRDNQQASTLLLQRLSESDNPEFRSRIVLLLEDMRGDDVTAALMDVARNDTSEKVRSDAVMVLMDRRTGNNDSTREFLTGIAMDNTYPLSMRTEIAGRLDNWYGDLAIVNLARLVATETDVTLVEAAADALADIGSDPALEALTNSYRNLANDELKSRVLEEIADVELDSVISWLTDIAINETNDALAAVAIEGIADRENNVAVAALDHIYTSTDSAQRKMAAIHGIGDAGTLQSVEFLQQAATGTDDLLMLREIVRALGDTNLEAAVPVLASIYQSQTDTTIRAATIRALRQLDEYDLALETMLTILEERIAAEENQP